METDFPGPTLAKQVIRAFGGATKMARALSAVSPAPIPIQTVHSWGTSKSGTIPWVYRPYILKAAKKANAALPDEFTAEAAE